MKPFKTYAEQIEILKNKNLIVSDEEKAKEILSQINYYNLVNGYKSVFLERNEEGKILHPEKFIANSNFEDLHNLYLLDQNLKHILFKYLLRFEKLFKSCIAYKFSEKYGGDYSYLMKNHYSDRNEDLDSVLKTIAILSGKINKENKKNGKLAINHYAKLHNDVPLWVLVNFLTFGNITHFYKAMKPTMRNNIARIFGEQYKINYKTDEKIGDEEMNQIVKMIRYFRNLIAHDEVIFTFEIQKLSKIDLFNKYFEQKIFKGKNLFDLILVLKLVIPKEEYLELLSEINGIFEKYKDKFSVKSFEEIIQIAGFKKNWLELTGMTYL